MPETQTLIVGAGPAGLACAAALKEAGRSALILEQSSSIAPSWRRHYDRLHLHTQKRHSGLPGMAMPAAYPKYPSRDQFIAYLQDYGAHHGIAPRFGERVARITKPDSWRVETQTGSFTADNVIVATGIAPWPHRPSWPGLDTFTGRLLHSSEYANAKPFTGASSVLVVGFGNSGGEIAMELADAGIDVALSVRSPVNIVPRDLFGISIVTLAIANRRLPYRLADAINAPIIRMVVGDIAKLGLRRAAKGPLAQITEDGRVPLLDIGTVDRIRRGKIAVRAGVDRISGNDVHFADGTVSRYDTIIAATGYRPDLRAILPDHGDVLDATGAPKICGQETQYPGLFFCGQVTVTTGQLREIGIEARHIAAAIRTR